VVNRQLSYALWLVLAGGAVLLSLAGCGGTQAEEQVAAPPPPPTDPRFATPEALIDFFNLQNSKWPPDVRGIHALFYAENDVQKRVISALEQYFAIFDFFAALHERFGSPLEAEVVEKLTANSAEHAVLKKVDDRRGKAESTLEDHSTRLLYLLQYENRWWISGYSFEYDPKLKKLLDDPQALEDFEKFGQILHDIFEIVNTRLRTGQCYSRAEAFVNLEREMALFEIAHSDESEAFDRYIREHRAFFPDRSAIGKMD